MTPEAIEIALKVGKIEGVPLVTMNNGEPGISKGGGWILRYDPANDPAIWGPLIEKYKLKVSAPLENGWAVNSSEQPWCAGVNQSLGRAVCLAVISLHGGAA